MMADYVDRTGWEALPPITVLGVTVGRSVLRVDPRDNRETPGTILADAWGEGR